MINRTKIVLAAAAAALLAAPASWAALSVYTQDFEALVPTDLAALSGDGFLVSGLAFDGDIVTLPPYGTFKFFYGNFPAPNGGPAFSAIATGEGGAPQGLNVLNVYSDYNCCSGTAEGHYDVTAPYDFVQSNVFHEQTIGPLDVGSTWSLKFDAKLPSAAGCNTTPASDCIAFIRTLDPNAAFAQTNFVSFDSQNGLTTAWSTHVISISLASALLNGQILQFGFQSTSQALVQGAPPLVFSNTGVFYDNIRFSNDTDADGVQDVADNCLLKANNTGAGAQCDSDADGFGNACDGDMNNNGVTNSQDYVLFRQQLGQPSVAPVYNKADINCNTVVNSQDYVLFRGLLGKPAGPGAFP